MTRTSDTVSYEITDKIGLICIDNPPVNACGHSVRTGIYDAIKALEAKVSAIAIYGAGRCFIAGADITEFGKPIAEPTMPDICLALENCKIPTIAVVHGATLGGGLEIAISAHARVALPDLITGFPEVGLGVLPGSGGTQRGPRLIGIKATLELATTGRRIGSQEALELGLVDRVETGEPKPVAVKAANLALNGDLPVRATSSLTVASDRTTVSEFANCLRKTHANLYAPHRIVECVALSTGDFTAGMEFERSAFFDCVSSPQRAGLIHSFFAERAVSKIPEAKAAPREIAKIGVIGGGTMGTGIATACLLAGYPVILIEQNEQMIGRASEVVQKNLDGALKRGKIDPEKHEKLASSLTLSNELNDVRSCDLVIEAVFEDAKVKREVFEQLDTILPEGAILASNTSYLDLNQIASTTRRPQDVIGLHFFSPAHVMKLLEIVVGEKTAPETVATGFAFAKKLRKIAVRSGVCDGFIGNRILNQTRKVADALLLEGASPQQIDRALTNFGFAMGPFAVLDLAGLDIGWAARKRRAPTRPANERYIKIADRICEQGWFGRKTGRGYYVYSGSEVTENKDVLSIIDVERAATGTLPREFTDQEIVERYLTAMSMEAALIVQDGIALRPIDVDAVKLFGYGFPKHHGGPLHYADQVGIPAMIQRLENLAMADPQFWQVPEIMRRLAANNKNFASLN